MMQQAEEGLCKYICIVLLRHVVHASHLNSKSVDT